MIATNTALTIPIATSTSQETANPGQPRGREDEPCAEQLQLDRLPEQPPHALAQPHIPIAERKEFPTLQYENDLDRMNKRIRELETMLQAATSSTEAMSDKANTARKSRKPERDKSDD